MTKNGSFFAHLALEFVRVTEFAAIAAAKWNGKGDKIATDKAAVDEMRKNLNRIAFTGEIVIGEGAKDEAPELYIGEKVGAGGGPLLDIAVDPLECTASVAYERPNAMTVIAVGPRGTLYKAADAYMEKIAVGPAATNVINLDAPPKDNIRKVAKALGKPVGEITVAVLDRERHQDLIKKIRDAGARIQIFSDGDIAMSIATCMPESPVDILMGTGGSTEAVLSAAALKCLGGKILGRWNPKDEKQMIRLRAAGIADFKKIFSGEDLAKGENIAFTATGVITGPILEGVTFNPDHVTTHTVVMSSSPKTVRFITTRYRTNGSRDVIEK